MKRTLALGTLLLILGTTALAVAEPCLSPYVKRLAGPEKFLYVYSVDADTQHNDFLAVVDANMASPTYGQLLTTVDLGSKGNEPHHMGYTDDRTKIWAGGLMSTRLFIFRRGHRPRAAADRQDHRGHHGPHRAAWPAHLLRAPGPDAAHVPLVGGRDPARRPRRSSPTTAT
jgi:hypothetical protein